MVRTFYKFWKDHNIFGLLDFFVGWGGGHDTQRKGLVIVKLVKYNGIFKIKKSLNDVLCVKQSANNIAISTLNEVFVIFL